MHLHQTKIRKAAIWLCEASSTFLFIRKHSANIKTQGLPVLSKCVYLFNINARYIIRLLKSPAVHIKKAQLHFFSAHLFSASHLRAELCPDPRHTALLLQRGSAPLRVDGVQPSVPPWAPVVTPTGLSLTVPTAGGSRLTWQMTLRIKLEEAGKL